MFNRTLSLSDKSPTEQGDVRALGSTHTLNLISYGAITDVSRSKADTSVQQTCGRRQRRTHMFNTIIGLSDKSPTEQGDVCALGSTHTLNWVSCGPVTGVSRSKADTSVQQTCGRRQRRTHASRYKGRPRKSNRRREKIFQLHQPGRG